MSHRPHCMRMSLGHIVLSHRGHTQKDKPRRILSHEISRRAKFTETESRGDGTLAGGEWEGLTEWGQSLSVKMKESWKQWGWLCDAVNVLHATQPYTSWLKWQNVYCIYFNMIKSIIVKYSENHFHFCGGRGWPEVSDGTCCTSTLKARARSPDAPRPPALGHCPLCKVDVGGQAAWAFPAARRGLDTRQDTGRPGGMKKAAEDPEI